MKLTQEIQNKQELITFLESESTSYSKHILNLIHRDSNSLGDQKLQKHHIIPSHCGGPDDDWNLIVLTCEEHAIAHVQIK